MGNRITFEASIDIEPFRKSIVKMTEMTSVFFDMADARANAFSETLGSVGNNFNISDQFDAANASISEGASAIDSYNRSLSGTTDALVAAAAMALTKFGPKGILASVALTVTYAFIQSESFERMKADAEEARKIHQEMVNEMEYSWGNYKRGIEQNFEEITEAHSGLNYSMLADMQMFGYELADFSQFRIDDAIEANEVVKKSFRSMVDDIFTDALDPFSDGWSEFYDYLQEGARGANEVVTESFKKMNKELLISVLDPLNEEWGGFYETFEKGAEITNKAVKLSFESMSKDVSSGALTRIGEDCDALWERLESGAGGVTHAIKRLFEGLSSELRKPLNGIISLVNGKVQRVIEGLNGVIGGINAMGFDLPPWLGGGSFRPNIPKIPSLQIPMLARGGIVDRPTLALIGERGKEAVMPLENNTGWITDLANSIGAVVGAQLSSNQSALLSNYSALDSDRPINLYLDGRKVAEGIMDDFVEVAKWRDIQLSPVFG